LRPRPLSTLSQRCPRAFFPFPPPWKAFPPLDKPLPHSLPSGIVARNRISTVYIHATLSAWFLFLRSVDQSHPITPKWGFIQSPLFTSEFLPVFPPSSPSCGAKSSPISQNFPLNYSFAPFLNFPRAPHMRNFLFQFIGGSIGNLLF